MKISYLIIGIVLFLSGILFRVKWVIAIGVIFVIISFSEKKTEVEKGKEQHSKILTSKGTCPNCGAEVLSSDNYCPECGKKIIP